MLADDTILHTTGKSVVQIQKTLQLCLDNISVWCNVNHMLINPVKTKSVIITTRQEAPALRLVIEIVIVWSHVCLKDEKCCIHCMPMKEI